MRVAAIHKIPSASATAFGMRPVFLRRFQIDQAKPIAIATLKSVPIGFHQRAEIQVSVTLVPSIACGDA